MRKTRNRSPRKAPPRRAAKSRRMGAEERKAKILETALPLFARLGYAATGTRALARAAGITEPILYRHFAGKADLFASVLTLVSRRIAAAADEAVEGTKGTKARLQALAKALPELLETYRDEIRVLTAATLAASDKRIRRAVATATRRIGRTLVELFRGSGLRRGADPETAGFLLLELGMGASLLRPLRLAEMDRDFGRRAVDLLLKGIAR